MKKSEMILTIASALIHPYTNFMPWDKAQHLAEIILNEMEKEGMTPPYREIASISIVEQYGFKAPRRSWEPENE